MLQRVIDTIFNNVNHIKYSVGKSREDYLERIKKMYEAGWDALPDETVCMYKGNQVIIKRGNTVVNVSFKNNDFSVIDGKYFGKIEKINKVIELDEAKKDHYLAYAVITRFCTIRKCL